MKTPASTYDVWQISALLRGEPELILSWVREFSLGRMLLYAGLICVGAGCYGAAVGFWRDPLLAFYTAVKFPLLILLTTLGNALLNGMLAPLLGLNISFRSSLLVIFMSFTTAAAILGSLSPILLFVVWNLPPLAVGTSGTTSVYAVLRLATTAGIAFAGLAANVRLFPLLRALSGSPLVARRVLFAWLAGNLLLGSQVCWILRPFIGNPWGPVAFLREHPLEGNFFESIYYAVRHLLFS